MEDAGGKLGRRPGSHLQVEASGPGNARPAHCCAPAVGLDARVCEGARLIEPGASLLRTAPVHSSGRGRVAKFPPSKFPPSQRQLSWPSWPCVFPTRDPFPQSFDGLLQSTTPRHVQNHDAAPDAKTSAQVRAVRPLVGAGVRARKRESLVTLTAVGLEVGSSGEEVGRSVRQTSTRRLR